MEELIILGTGNAMVTRCYNTCFALRTDGQVFLVDAGGGNGILAALERADIDARRIRNVFVTHAHTDHILGMTWIIRKIGAMMLDGKYDGDLTIYCHDIAAEVIVTIARLTMQKKFTDLIGKRILLQVVEDGDTADIDSHKVHFFDIGSTKAKQFGFYLTLQNDEKFVCIGDEPCQPHCEAIARDCGWLLCEAFCRYADRERFRPYEKHHSTVRDACALAERLGVKNLVLWHTEDKTLDTRRERYTEEGAQLFSGSLYVPDDLDVISLS